MTKTSTILISTLGIALISISFAVYFAFAGQVQAADGSVYLSGSNLYNFDDATVVPGTISTLSRTNTGISATVQTGNLTSGHAYTLWWVIFNNPEYCEHGEPGMSNCGEGDVFAQPLGDSPVQVSVQNAGGNIIGGTGKGDFGAYLHEEALPSGEGQLVFGSGLIDAEKAEVHLVLRDHGPVLNTLEDSQISAFGGGCTPETDPTQVGPFGENNCADVQFAVHMPPERS